VTLTLTPDEGYQYTADSLRANKAGGGTVDLSGDGPYTFAMPADNVTVAAEFEAIPYSISVSDSITNGDVIVTVGDVAATSAVVGQTVTLTPTPDEEYQYTADSLRVTKAGGGTVELSGDGPYTFAMPASNVTVSAEFEVGASFTNNLGFPEETNAAFGVALADWQGEGAAQTVTLTAGEETTVYFAVNKGAGQSITVGGTDAAAVQAVTIAGETPEGFTVPTLDDTIAVYALDVAELIFDGDFEATTKPARTFTLMVEEQGLDSIVYTVTLQPSLDTTAVAGDGSVVASTVSIYQRKDGKWLKIRNPLISADNVAFANASDLISDAGAPVKDLTTALAWVCHNAESGTGQGLVGGTTAGHSEYRIFLKASQQIPRVEVRYPDGTDYVSLELYGAGPTGAVERKITADTSFFTNAYNYNVLNREQSQPYSYYWINLPGSSKHHTLVLEKNVTVDGGKQLFSGGGMGDSDTHWQITGTTGMIRVAMLATLIMRDHAKITGYFSVYIGGYPIYIQGSGSKASGYNKAYFYMQGGTITDNIFNDQLGVVVLNNSGDTMCFFDYTGGVISANTQNRVIATNGTVKWPK
jgi:hypothetical protein